MKYVPHPYQQRAIDRAIHEPRMGLFLDPGLGKTSVILEAFRQMRERFDARRMLVIAPLQVVYSVWPAEVEKWDNFKDLRIQIIHGRQRTTNMRTPAEIYVTNPESLPWLAKRGWDWPSTLVIDESTKFKHAKTARMKALRRVLRYFERRYILTGTPAPNGLMDLWGQMFILDHGKALGETLTEYRRNFFVPVPRGMWNDWVLARGSEELIYKAIAPKVMRIGLEEAGLNLKGFREIPIRVTMPDKARAQYSKLRQEMVLELKAGNVLAANGGVLTSKCRQLANGAVYLEDDGWGRKVEQVHKAKMDALERLVAELGGKPVLIAYEFNHDLAAIKKIWPRMPVLGGKESPKLVERWNRGELPWLALHPKSGGHGLNLQDGGHILIWYSLTWDLEQYDQVIHRIFRMGQKNPVLVYQIIASGTVDETVARTLQRKERDQQALLEALREDLA